MKHLSSNVALLALILASCPFAFAQTEQEVDQPDLEEEAREASEPIEGQIILQSENTILAEDLIGLNVYSPADEDVGEIDNLIINLDGTVEGVIVGVGGFLGIGEKNVAIEMQALELTPIDDVELRLVLSTTREELEAAPGFVSMSEQDAVAARKRLEGNAGTTATLPKDPVDPATASGTTATAGEQIQ